MHNVPVMKIFIPISFFFLLSSFVLRSQPAEHTFEVPALDGVSGAVVDDLGNTILYFDGTIGETPFGGGESNLYLVKIRHPIFLGMYLYFVAQTQVGL